MTTASLPRPAEASAAPRTRRRVRWGDLLALTGRQHRGMLTGTSVLAAALAVALLVLGLQAAGHIGYGMLSLLSLIVQLYTLAVAVFWAGPLVAREYEQHTHLWAWSQDVSRTRWLAGKTLLLLPTAAVSAVALGFCTEFLTHRANTLALASGSVNNPIINPFLVPFFDSTPLPLLGYALFGFALGLAFSVLTRRTVISMGLSFVIFLATRIVLASAARPHYATPLRTTAPLGGHQPLQMPHGALPAGFSYLDTTGTPVGVPAACRPDQSTSCLRAHGIIARSEAYQPPGRLVLQG